LRRAILSILLAAISDVAKARGMAKIASDSGLGRESLLQSTEPESNHGLKPF
jgi:probable addiction module antidote protein